MMTWIGVGLAAVGAGVVAGGAILNLDSAAQAQAIESERCPVAGCPAGALSQDEAIARINDAHMINSVSIGMMVGGGALAVTGALLATLDLTVWQPKTSVQVSAQGASVTFAFDF